MNSEILAIKNLPDPLQKTARVIARVENMDPDKITFEKTADPNYMRMLEGGAETGYGYFIEEQEID